MSEHDVAGAVVEAVLANLMYRRGIKQELQQIESEDPETWAEIKETLTGIVEAVLAEGADPGVR